MQTESYDMSFSLKVLKPNAVDYNKTFKMEYHYLIEKHKILFSHVSKYVMNMCAKQKSY